MFKLPVLFQHIRANSTKYLRISCRARLGIDRCKSVRDWNRLWSPAAFHSESKSTIEQNTDDKSLIKNRKVSVAAPETMSSGHNYFLGDDKWNNPTDNSWCNNCSTKELLKTSQIVALTAKLLNTSTTSNTRLNWERRGCTLLSHSSQGRKISQGIPNQEWLDCEIQTAFP